jgi:hypothetical protein
MAAPVWFIEPKVMPKEKSVGSQSSIVRYFCDLAATDRFAHLFQIYNHSPRYFKEFTGRDVIPLPIIEFVGKVRNSFDYLVIATPYHDLAAEQWRDSRWIRNIDPFLFGFLKQVPELMFFLGRWSGTGLFPLIGDMIADTIEHIKKNKRYLGGFESKTSWYGRGVGKLFSISEVEGIIIKFSLPPPIVLFPHPLLVFTDKLLEHFEQGNLFSWLRDENK